MLTAHDQQAALDRLDEIAREPRRAQAPRPTLPELSIEEEVLISGAMKPSYANDLVEGFVRR